jgi:hypothetical protein
LKCKPNKLLIILPEFKEREYWHKFDTFWRTSIKLCILFWIGSKHDHEIKKSWAKIESHTFPIDFIEIWKRTFMSKWSSFCVMMFASSQSKCPTFGLTQSASTPLKKKKDTR